MSSNNLGGLVSSPRLAWIYYTPTIHLNVTLSLVRIRELFTDRLLENNIIKLQGAASSGVWQQPACHLLKTLL
jgi:hypothetical protein